MKRRFLLFCMLIFLTSIPVCAYDFVVNGIYYSKLSDTEVKVTNEYDGSSGKVGYVGMSGSIVIPDTVTYDDMNYAVTAIGDNAFSTSSYFEGDITFISIPNSVKSIGDYAFSGTSITSVVIPDNVISLGKGTFSGCSSLQSVVIGNGVTAIRESLFSGCNALQSLSIGSGVTSVGSYAIPSTRTLTDVYITDLTSWCNISGKLSFYYPFNLHLNGDIITDLTIPEDVINVRSYAFYNCNLTSVTLPDNVKSIGSFAFDSETITSVHIGAGLDSLGSYSPFDNAHLASIVIESANPKFDSRINCNAIIETSTNTLVVGCNETIIPDGIVTIGKDAFSGCKSITSISLPGSVTTIQEGAFRYCGNLIAINFPERLTTIGKEAFSGCRSLTSVVIPIDLTSIGEYAFYGCEKLTTVGSLGNINIVANYCFSGCNSLTAISIPDGVTEISSSAFSGCAFTSITIPNSVTSIKEYAFRGCRGLSSIIIPNSVTSMGYGALSNCENLTTAKVYIEEPITYNSFFGNNEQNMVLYVPVGTCGAYRTADGWKKFKSILNFNGDGEYTDGDTFKALNADSVEITFKVISAEKKTCQVGDDSYTTAISKSLEGTLRIPDQINGYTVTKIGNNAFRYCKISSVSLPEGLTSIGEEAFIGCDSLESVVLPETISSIGEEAFYNSGLTSVVLPIALKKIEKSTFAYCKNLTSVFISQEVESIDNSAFYYCRKLEEIIVDANNSFYDSRNNCNAIVETASNTLILGCENTVIDNTVTSIGKDAFDNCQGLQTIEIPSSVTSIGNSAFSYSGLVSITIPSSVKSIGDGAFYSCRKLEEITLQEGLTSLGDGVFEYCEKLREITIPGSLEQIGSIHDDGLFHYCSGLKSVTINEGVKVVGKKSFSSCQNLCEVNLPTSLLTIGESAFQFCKNLRHIKIPESVTEIGNYAFEYSGLETITIPSNVTNIGKWAFGCGNIKAIFAQRLTPPSFDEVYDEVQAILFVPEGSKAAYSADPDWNLFEQYGSKQIVEMVNGNSFHIKNEENVELTYQITDTEQMDVMLMNTEGDFNSLIEDTVTIPSKVCDFEVTAIGDDAFSGCTNLEAVIIPNSIQSIGQRSFSGCSGLTSVTVNWETPITISANCFSNRANATLYVPAVTKFDYKKAPVWKEFMKMVEPDIPDTDISELENAIYIDNTEGIVDGRMTLSVKMKNAEPTTGFNFDLYLPEGFSFAKNSEGKEIVRLSSRRTTEQKTDRFSYTVREDGALRVGAYSKRGTEISGNDGEIVLVTIMIDKEVAQGNHPIILKNMAVIDPQSTDEKEIEGYCKSTITIMPYIRGDVNYSQPAKVNAQDLFMIASYMMGKRYESGFNMIAADVNGDGEIDIADLTAASNFFLYDKYERPVNVVESRMANNNIDPQ